MNNTTYNGLTDVKVKKLLEKYGFNELTREKSKKIQHILWEQFSSPLILILLATAIISLVLSFLPGQDHNIFDGILIIVIVFLSAMAGFFQDYRAEKTIESLQQMSMPKVTVRRQGKEKTVSSREIVPQDVVILRAGDIVPADAKVIFSEHLSVDESAITGESVNIDKKTDDLIFKGTTVQVGQGEVLVLKTGMRTKLGKIASTMQNINNEITPFQSELKKISRIILWFIGSVIFVIFSFSLHKFGLFDSLLFAISLAVAAIPEGLPAVMAVVLALGARAMVDKKALVRKLSAVESMGDVQVICTDKTGTITKNEMDVIKLYTQNKEIVLNNKKNSQINKQLLLAGALCNDAQVIYPDHKNISYVGSQTEIATMKFVSNYLTKQELNNYHRLNEIPFDHDRKFMSVLCENKEKQEKFVYMLGAPERVLEKCDFILNENNKVVKFNDDLKKKIINQYEKYSKQALRVLGAAYKVNDSKSFDEENMIWGGLIAMTDPPRKGVEHAISEVYQAGIRVVMLTGDYHITAEAVAKQVGLETAGIITGDELENMDKQELNEKLKAGYNVFARISPFHKLRILKALKNEYVSIAMTGDGVNDALALKQSDIGIAMGVRGTAVAKEASDIILLDDHFATIRDAIKEGRRSLDNVKKFINYLAVSNIAEIGVLFIATVFMSLSTPILAPVHLLWINLITDGFPAIALGLDPAKKGIMKNKPRGNRPLIDKKLQWQISAIGIKKIIILFITFLILLKYGKQVATTALFTGFILYEFVRIATIRQQEGMSLFVNKWVLWALVVSLILQLVIIYSPLNVLFNVVALPLVAWIVLLLGIGIGYISAIYITKFINYKFAEK